MIRILGTALAGLLGLAFGSFLNVCLSRWPEGESVVKPRSHCRDCGRTLTWWENIPVASWLALRGRCRTCNAKISWRYPLVESAVGMIWATLAWQAIPDLLLPHPFALHLYMPILTLAKSMALCFLLVGLAELDAEHLWLPNVVTIPGTLIGFVLALAQITMLVVMPLPIPQGFTGLNREFYWAAAGIIFGIVAPAGLVLLIRWTYKLVRRREGIGLGDAKLMAMLGAWLGLSGALLSFAIGVVIGAIFALIALGIPAARRESNTWLDAKLPLGTFLCIGGIISALWGQPIIAAYLHWAGF